MSERVEAQAKTSSTPITTQAQPQLQQRTFSAEVAPNTSQSVEQQSYLQTQLERINRFGDNFGRVKVYADTPQVIQPKLVIGPPGDKYEQEADQVAARVMAMPNPVSQPSAQRQLSEESKSPLSASILRTAQRQEPQLPIQRKSLLQRSAELSAEKNNIQRFGEEDNPVQRWSLVQSITPVVQRQVDEQVQMRSLVQRAFQAGGNEASGDLEGRLNASSGGGSALAPEVRAFMEPRFGVDFSSVRVHTDSTAVQMNKDLGAQAFTHGSDIYFGGGKSPAISDLTAHELTHVVQQTGAKKLQRKPNTSLLKERDTIQSKELRRQPTEQEQETLQAKELSSYSSELGLNKELRRQPIREEQENETIQPKRSSDDNYEINPDLSKAPPDATAKAAYEKTLSETESQTDAEKEAGVKTQPSTQVTTATPPESVTAEPQSATSEAKTKPTLEPAIPETQESKGSKDASAVQSPSQDLPLPKEADAAGAKAAEKEAGVKTQLSTQVTTATPPESVTAEPQSATSEAKTKPTLEPVIPETQESKGSKDASAVQSPSQDLPLPKEADAAGAKAAPQAMPVEVAQKAQAENASPAQAAPEATAVAAAPPSLDSGGGSAEESSQEASGGGEEAEIEAAAAKAPPGSAQLEPAEREAALASLAEGVGGGGEAVGGGGGGAAIADKPTPPTPDVSQAEPSAALAAVSNLPPAQLLGALGGVGAAVGTSVGKQRAELAANPPQMERPTGSPMTSEGSAADRSMPSGKNPKAVAKTPEGQAKPVPQPKPVALSSTPPVAKVPQPQVKGDAEGKLDAGDAQKLQASLRSLPTSDPGLQQVSASASPRLELQGNADPQQAQQQQGELEKGIADAHSKGQQELAQPMGENEIYPKVPQETLRAEGISGGGGAAGGAAAKAAGGAAAGGGEGGDEAVSIIAQQEHSQEIYAGVAKAQAEIAAKRQEHSTKVEEEKARSHQEIAQLQTENSAQQAAERAKAQAEVQQQRSAWQKEQDALITKSRQDADQAVSKGNKDVQQEQTQAETKASEHIQKGEEEAAAARQKGEQDAEKERQKGEQESGGILGWLADKAKAFFDGIKQAIQKAFEVARAAVKAAIEGAQKLATAVIETARQAIVGIIKAVGAALIAIGDVLLAAFPEMRDRFRNAIKGVVKAAETAVNALADTLKKGVQAALNLLGKGLDAALGLLEKGMMAAVDIAKTAVQGAIKLADAAIKAIGAFAVLVKDVAANPSQWLSNLGTGANDGIKNHFWGAFQTAVKEWFSQKVEEVLGLGMTIWNVLKQGGINLPEVAKMAWEGIKSAIPGVLIQLLIEKVVSMIVPAAGTVMVIIEGLQAAWGTVSRILQAFERFMAFLKAVKTGQAGPPFGAALAAAGVVVIDFVSNWLLKRLRGPASKVAGKIKEIATKIGKKIKKVVKKLGKKFSKLKDKFFGKKGNKGEKDKGHGREGDHKNNKGTEGEEHKDPQHDAKVAKGLRQIDLEETRYLQNSAITKKNAKKVAAKVKTDNPVFKSITVVDGGNTWDYVYVASPPKRKKGEQQQKKMPLVVVTPFVCNTTKFDFGEYVTQVQGQEAGINTLKVSEWHTNRTRYLAEGRSPEGAQHQKEYRQKHGLTSEEAALHEPDQVAGGGYKVKKKGSKSINSSIGSQWKTKIVQLDAAVTKVEPDERTKVYMNVKLSVVSI